MGWYQCLNKHEFEQTAGDREGQGGLACCSPWDCKESDMTEQLNNNNDPVARPAGDPAIRYSSPQLLSHPKLSNLSSSGSPLVVWWLGFKAFTVIAWVQSLVWDLRSLKSHSVVKKIKKKNLPSSSSRHYGEEPVYPCCVLSKCLIHRIHDQDKLFKVTKE